MDYSLEKLTNQQLDFINARFISPDKDMFSIKTVGAGFNTVIAERVINFILENCSSFYSGNTIVIINDLSLHMTKALIDAGISPKNIKLTFCKFDNKSKTLINNNSAISKIFKLHPVIRQNKDLQIITFKEVQSMKINGIIANPPYNTIGANITDAIRATVDYDEYVNLLPANDYKRNKTKDLFNYQAEMEAINNGFEDASVTTHLAKVYKTKVNNLTASEYEINNYLDRSLDLYFKLTAARHSYLYDNYNKHGNATFSECDATNSLIFGERDLGHGHMPYSKKVNSYKWNVEESISELTYDCNGKVRYIFIKFATPSEKKNCSKFIYSIDGFRFISKLFTSMNKDGCDVGPIDFLPKVDWSREWTVEEILADYGYTEPDIQEIMNDLNNYKYIED